MVDGPHTQCPNCRRLEAIIAKFEARIAALEDLVHRQADEIARLKKNSSTSHKPPSSDIVKPPKPPTPNGEKRKIGGQPGHERHERTPFSRDEIDRTETYTLPQCPDCGGRLQRSSEPPQVIQQVELVARPVEVTEHRALAYWCPQCRKVHYAVIPESVAKGGLAGPRLTALAAWLKGAAHASYGTIFTFARDVLGIQMSTGELAKLIQKTRRAMDGAYAELLAALPGQSRLNVDETGHPDRGKNLWTWGFRAPEFTLFRIAASRGSDVLLETLGREFNGLLGCDYFSAYRKYMGDFGVAVQFCMAHLIRDVKFLLTVSSRTTRRYGRRLLDALRSLFHVIHRRETMTAAEFRRSLECERRKVTAAALHSTWTPEAAALGDRFRSHARAYFRFITTPGIDPTNNLAEQAIRFVVIDRRVTQGTRGANGQAWCERIWTANATCAQQGRPLFEYLCQTLHAHFTGRPAPSLLLNSS
jgi:transposase